jgi:hypothetical protein
MGSTPISTSKNVLLPQPEGPMRAQKTPFGTSKFRFLKTDKPVKLLES